MATSGLLTISAAAAAATHLPPPLSSRYLLPKLRASFPQFPDRSPEELYGAINVMREPSMIRVESDEVGGWQVVHCG